MKCNPLNLDKYINKGPKVFFIYGSETVLRNQSKEKILNYLSSEGFEEILNVFTDDISDLDGLLMQNAAGSLFANKQCIVINHLNGKTPESFKNIHKYIDEHYSNALIVMSCAEKISPSASWVKELDKNCTFVACVKLKSFEEKIWLKNQLNFLEENEKKKNIENIYNLNQGNLIAQQNEINLLELQNINGKAEGSDINNAEYIPFDLEDMIIKKDKKNTFKILHSIRDNNSHYGPLITWVLGNLLNACVYALSSNNIKNSLQISGVFNSKLNQYEKFIKSTSPARLVKNQKKIVNLDLACKGIIKKDFWKEIDYCLMDLLN